MSEIKDESKKWEPLYNFFSEMMILYIPLSRVE